MRLRVSFMHLSERNCWQPSRLQPSPWQCVGQGPHQALGPSPTLQTLLSVAFSGQQPAIKDSIMFHL